MYEIEKQLELGINIFKTIGFKAELDNLYPETLVIRAVNKNELFELNRLIADSHKEVSLDGNEVRISVRAIESIGLHLEKHIKGFNLDRLSKKVYVTNWEPIPIENLYDYFNLTHNNIFNEGFNNIPSLYLKYAELLNLNYRGFVIDTFFDLMGDKPSYIDYIDELDGIDNILNRALLELYSRNRGRRDFEVELKTLVHSIDGKGIVLKRRIVFKAEPMDLTNVIDELALIMGEFYLAKQAKSSAQSKLPKWLEELKAKLENTGLE